MNNTGIIRMLFALTALLVLKNFAAAGQPAAPGQAPDTLTLGQLISAVIAGHPTVKEAEEALRASDAKIGLAKSGFYPNVDASASYTRIGPVPEFNFPSFGVIKLYPENNYSATLNYSQTLYDFGKTSKEVALEEQNKVLSGETLEQVKQKMALAAANCFYTLAYLQDAVRIKEEEINTLKSHLGYLRKKNETGSATRYELLVTEVKISGIESQKTDLESARKVQLSVLNSLTGRPSSENHMVKPELSAAMPAMNEDSLAGYALAHRDEMKIALQKENIAALSLDLAKSQKRPVVNIYANAGGKNGYVPDIGQVKANFAAGLGVKVPLFDATRTRNKVLQAESAIRYNSLEAENVKRNIVNEVTESLASLTSAGKKAEQFRLQGDQARQALLLAQTSYRNGTITNLDLLDAATSLSESDLALLKSQIDLSLSLFRLEAALGKRLY